MIIKFKKGVFENFGINGEFGFTLIGLLIVIAVLGILAGVVIPQVSDVRDDAEGVAVEVGEHNTNINDTIADLFGGGSGSGDENGVNNGLTTPTGNFSELQAGDNDAGYFGVVSDLIDGSELETKIVDANDEIEIAKGDTLDNHSNTKWLKFAHEDKTLFVAKQAIRHSISWDDLYDAKVVYGGYYGNNNHKTTIEIDDNEYIVRLMRGATEDPYNDEADDKDSTNSEWNNLMIPIHENSINQDWDHSFNDVENVETWDINDGNGTDDLFNNSDLLVEDGDGRTSWAMETPSKSSLYRLFRGGLGVSIASSNFASQTISSRGWRPVLELVE